MCHHTPRSTANIVFFGQNTKFQPLYPCILGRNASFVPILYNVSYILPPAFSYLLFHSLMPLMISGTKNTGEVQASMMSQSFTESGSTSKKSGSRFTIRN